MIVVVEANAMPNVESLLRDHVTLQVDCIDRLYLNGYVPLLQRPENLWWFLHEHRKHPIVSPVLLKQMTEAFVGSIDGFAERNQIPVIHFEADQRKEDVARKHLARFKGDEGIVMIGVAQEMVSGFRMYQEGPRRRHRTPRGGLAPRFRIYRGKVHVNQYYFYILDRNFGLTFIKFSSYAPFPIRVWLNGHEWAKRQLDRKGIRYQALDNGFLSCEDPEALQNVCHALGTDDIDRFFRRWLRQLPHPFTPKDRAAGYRYQLSILQMEVSLTQVFDRPVHGREFFEEVIRDNLDIGRPDQVQLLFERRINKRTPGRFRTRVITEGVQPSLRFDYKHCRVKQYFKLERALRTETTFNDTYDFKVGRNIRNLSHLRSIGRNINHRLLTIERVAQNCAIASRTVENIVLPTKDDGQHAPALRWGDPRTVALFAALCGFIATPVGFTNRTLRDRVRALHNPEPDSYDQTRMTYDLRRLRLKGLIVRVPRSHRYLLTPLGRRAALFMSKSFTRIVRPVLHRVDPALPDNADDALRRAWLNCERAIDQAVAQARIAA
jgi:hypothetical protein